MFSFIFRKKSTQCFCECSCCFLSCEMYWLFAQSLGVIVTPRFYCKSFEHETSSIFDLRLTRVIHHLASPPLLPVRPKLKTTSTRLWILLVLMPRPGRNSLYFENNGDNKSPKATIRASAAKELIPGTVCYPRAKRFSQPATHPLRHCSRSRAGASDSGWIHSREKCEE